MSGDRQGLVPKSAWVSLVALGVVLLCGAWLRLDQALALQVHPDEMLHLPSFRNRYGGEDIYPIFRQRLAVPGALPAALSELLLGFYQLGPSAQRALLIVMDGHPLFYPVIAELNQLLTGDGLLGLRLASVLASLGSVGLAFVLGRRLVDAATGVLFAALLSVSLWQSYYGGIGRTYAFVEFSALTFVLVALREQARGLPLSNRTLGAALFWQMTHWFNWPLVAGALVSQAQREWRAGTPVLRLLGRAWWYIASSCLLLVYLLAQRTNPTLRAVGGLRFDLMGVARTYEALSPACWLTCLEATSARVVTVVLLGMAILGGVSLRRWVPDPATRRIALWAPLAGAGLFLLRAAPEPRFFFSASLFLSLLAAIGLRGLLGPRLGIGVAVGWALLGVATQAACPDLEHPIRAQLLPGHAVTAPKLKQQIERTGAWISFPYFLADPYYHYDPGLPFPAQPQSSSEFDELLRRAEPVTVLTTEKLAREHPARSRFHPVELVSPGVGIYVVDPAPSRPEP